MSTYQLPDPPLRSTARSLTWSTDEQDGALRVTLNGDIDENAPLQQLQSELKGKVVLNLEKVRRINSAGVREWVNFIRDTKAQVDSLGLEAVSPAMITQVNMIYNFVAGADVRSFFAPYVCPACDEEHDILLTVGPEVTKGLPSHAPPEKCPSCQADLEFDDVPERYFAFLIRR